MDAQAYFLATAAQPLERRPLSLPEPGPGEVLVAVEACGLCHTDLAFADGSVRPRHPLPLVLGHEIAGRVVAAGEACRHLAGRPVLVPAVLPCGDCPFCAAGRGNACPGQRMPGNDIHGGFASHVLVPGGPLIPLDQAPPGVRLDALAVVADAVATAYQAVRRSGLAAGDAAWVIGAGGVGGFLIQIAAALGARVVACDVAPERLAAAGRLGAEETVCVADRPPREVRKLLHQLARGWRIPSLNWRIFEASGSTAGQLLAFGLLGPAATLVQVGYAAGKVEVRLSNLMAFDATVHGTWGAPPEVFPEVLQLIYDRRIELEPAVDHAPMSALNRLLDDMANHRLSRRMILHPDA
ncbi:MAG: 6-hydroxycyclohex-1-ene-1-carbonyl-CoA dehydrogenase [Acidobacteria bacterium]|nr:MAG: 6-hydroxycyclohex-1-ene-1-carbonyl-CoA dehydrogenase [Acidobacteriota bacterium]